MGGAPLNAALVAHAVGQPFGLAGQMVSRVGTDELGDQIVAALQARDVDTSTIQRDDSLATGTVQVEMVDGEPNYEIVRHVAWDNLQWNTQLAELASHCAGITFGTLAQRSATSRQTIQQFLAAAQQAFKLFDVNLRGDFHDAEGIRQGCQLANAIKLNRDELDVIAKYLELPEDDQVDALRQQYDLQAVILTHGSRGTELITQQGRFRGEVPSFAPQPGSDPVGAGDACGATCLIGFVKQWPAEQIVARANRVGAYVASRQGATPQFDAAELLNL